MFFRSLAAVSVLFVRDTTAGNINNHFDLDGDATYDGGATYDPNFPLLDWNLLASYIPPGVGGVEQCGNMDLEAAGIRGVFSGILHDQGEANFEEKFQFDQAKDTINPADYQWSHSPVPDKNDILNAYAFAHLDENNTINAYFGLDLFADPGSATVGFWFLQDDVHPVCDDGSEVEYPNGCQSGHFVGDHVDGDLLVLADIGGAANIRLLNWMGDASGSLNVDGPTLDEADPTCAVGQIGGTFGVNQVCAITNGQTEVPVCWSYTPKQGGNPPKCETGCKVGTERFFEGGINLQAYFKHVLKEDYPPCIKGFIAETRSSESETADLKDFVGGPIDMCGYESEYECGVPADIGNDQWQIPLTVRVKNTGLFTYYRVNVTSESGEVLATIDDLQPFASDTLNITFTEVDFEFNLTEELTIEYCVSPESPCRAERRQSHELPTIICGWNTTTMTPTSTTTMPTSTTETPTSTTQLFAWTVQTTTSLAPTDTTEESGDGNDNSFQMSFWQLIVAAAIGVCLLLFCFAGFCLRLKAGRNKKQPATENRSVEANNEAVGVEEMAEDMPLVEMLPPPHVRAGEESLSEDVEDSEGMGQRRTVEGDVENVVQQTTGGRTRGGFEPGDAVADEDIDDEIMYIEMPQTRR